MPYVGIIKAIFHNMLYICKFPKYRQRKFMPFVLFKQKEFYITVLPRITITSMSKDKVILTI